MKPYFGRCAVIGYGRTGKAVERLLLSYRNRVDVYEKLPKDVNSLASYDILVPSPGIPYWKFKDVPKKTFMLSDIDLAYMEHEGFTVGITGTNGKTTVTLMLESILEDAVACGNVGLPFAQAPQVGTYIVELSSFQLFYTKLARFNVGVILNVSPDHLDWHLSFRHYLHSKLKLVRNLLKPDAKVILNADDGYLKDLNVSKETFRFSVKRKAHAFYKDGYIYLLDRKLLYIANEPLHSIYNLLAVSLVLHSLGIPFADISSSLEKLLAFKLPHRMEYLGKLNGIDVFNDSKSTNPHALEHALLNFQKVVLIMGGDCKGLDFSHVSRTMEDRVSYLILVGKDADHLHAQFGNIKNKVVLGTLEDALRFALNVSKGEPILFSPGCASYDMFQNYEHRGNYFKSIIYNFKLMILKDESKLVDYLKQAKTIAVIGIKDGTDTPAGRIPRYLKAQGYRIIPVNPKLEKWLGQKVYRSIDEVEEQVDIVNIFRRSEAVLEHAREILRMKHKPKLVWMQEGIVNEEAAKLLSENGIDVVMDKCIYKLHSKFKQEGLL